MFSDGCIYLVVGTFEICKMVLPLNIFFSSLALAIRILISSFYLLLMASLVFSLSGGQTRAYAFESGDVITDINNLAQWDITDDTVRLEATLGKMTVRKIEDTLGALNFSTRKRGECTKAHMIRSFVQHWERIKTGAVASEAHRQGMALLEREVADGSAGGSASASGGEAVVPFGGYAHRLSDDPEGDDPATNLLGNDEVDELITKARDSGWNVKVCNLSRLALKEKYGIMSLTCTVLDLRGSDQKTLGTVNMTADIGKSVSTLCVEMAEYLHEQGLVEDRNWKQVIFYDAMPLVENWKSLKAYGITEDTVKVVVRLYSVDDARFMDIMTGNTDSQKVMTIQDFLDINDPEDTVPDEDDTALFSPSFLRVFEDDASLSVKVFVQQTLLFAVPMSPIATVADTKDRIVQTINSLQGHLKMPISSDDFVLKVSGRAMSDDAELSTFAMEGNTELRISMEFRIRGGGKAVKGVKKDTMSKAVVVAKLKTEMLKKVSSVNIPNMAVDKKIIEEAGQILTNIYNTAETNAEMSFRFLLQKLDAKTLGDTKSSQVMDALKLNHADARVFKLSELLLKDAFPALYNLYEEVGGMIESAEMTCEFVINGAFLKPDCFLNWPLIKKEIEAEQVRRAPPVVISSDDMHL